MEGLDSVERVTSNIKSLNISSAEPSTLGLSIMASSEESALRVMWERVSRLRLINSLVVLSNRGASDWINRGVSRETIRCCSVLESPDSRGI